MLSATLLTIGCADNSVATLHGELEGMSASDSIVVFYDGMKDTIAAPNGHFDYVFKDSVAGIVRLTQYAKKADAPRVPPITVMMFPGVSVDVEGDFYNSKISGGDFYKEYNAMYKEIEEVDKQRKAANERYMALVNAKAAHDDILRNFEELKVVDKKYQAHLEGYIAGHLNSEVSLFLLCNVHPNYGEKYIFDFTEALQKGPMRKMYASTLLYYKKNIAKKKAVENIQPGRMAPDFTVKDINGNDFTLSSLKGKYVVLDFWGSWCGWCISGFPEMKDLYEKFKDRIEFVGIACKDTEARWKKAVDAHGLKWTNVINPTDFDHDLTVIYNVTGYPTKVIISPEGQIMEVVVGEDREFYDAIRFLMMD